VPIATFVLVSTRTPGNLGAVCRVAKALDLADVRLVSPEADPRHEEARWLAHGAEDLLARTPVFASLREALAGCHRSAGATARPRNWGRPVLSPEEAAAALADRLEAAGGSDLGPYAVVFGPEDRGLTNEELGRCDEILSIPLPPSPEATLSLPQAASIVAWELARGTGRLTRRPAARGARSERSSRPLDSTGIDALVEEILGTLDEIGFRPRPNALRFRGNVRDFVSRARPTVGDRAVLRGMFAQVGKWRRRLEGRRRRGE
jgi:TrmH family RNA methyltransferase